jgi:DNA-binding transcriptional MerR regulator
MCRTRIATKADGLSLRAIRLYEDGGLAPASWRNCLYAGRYAA